FIPNIGPTISTLLASVIALTDNPIKAVVVVIAFIILQQLENHLIVPMVMKQAVGLNPVVIIIALMVGIKLAGPIGAIISVPFVAALSEFVSDIMRPMKHKKRPGFNKPG
ncbi:MAG: AI-2E family transporter, partial [Candidatus Moranbacteria bacterium]|nr:AI-2E family transporter [Candidatus Moranbacteria bacterium]